MDARTLAVTALVIGSVGLAGCSSDNTLGLGVAGGSNGLLYTTDAADELTRVDIGGRRIIKKGGVGG